MRPLRKCCGDAMVDVVGGEPVDFVDLDAEAIDGGGADVVPGEAAGFVGGFVADGADEAGVAGVVKGEDADESRRRRARGAARR